MERRIYEATHRQWNKMLKAVIDDTCPSYKHVGSKGIKLNPDWLDFNIFTEDMGYIEPGNYLTKTSPKADFYKDNCYWSDQQPKRDFSPKTKEYHTITESRKHLIKEARQHGVPIHYIDDYPNIPPQELPKTEEISLSGLCRDFHISLATFNKRKQKLATYPSEVFKTFDVNLPTKSSLYIDIKHICKKFWIPHKYIFVNVRQRDEPLTHFFLEEITAPEILPDSDYQIIQQYDEAMKEGIL